MKHILEGLLKVLNIKKIQRNLNSGIGLWCNGSTEDFGSSSIGSNPISPTNKIKQLIMNKTNKLTRDDAILCSLLYNEIYNLNNLCNRIQNEVQMTIEKKMTVNQQCNVSAKEYVAQWNVDEGTKKILRHAYIAGFKRCFKLLRDIL